MSTTHRVACLDLGHHQALREVEIFFVLLSPFWTKRSRCLGSFLTLSLFVLTHIGDRCVFCPLLQCFHTFFANTAVSVCLKDFSADVWLSPHSNFARVPGMCWFVCSCLYCISCSTGMRVQPGGETALKFSGSTTRFAEILKLQHEATCCRARRV